MLELGENMQVEQRRKPKLKEVKEYQFNEIPNDIYYYWEGVGQRVKVYFLRGESIEYFLNKLYEQGIEIAELKNAKLFQVSDNFALFKNNNIYIFVTIVADSLYFSTLDVKIELRIYYY